MSKYQFGSIVNRDFRNTLQRLADDAAAQGKAIQNLVAEGQLSEEQYANLINTVNGMLKSGEVDEYDLTPILRSEIRKVKDKIDRGDVSINDLAPSLLEIINNSDGTPFEILSIPRDRSVTPEKTTFFEVSSNIFDKETAVPGVINPSTGQLEESSTYWSTDFIPAKPNQSYVYDRFNRIIYYDVNKNRIGHDQSTKRPSTFVSRENTAFVRLSAQWEQYLDGAFLGEGSEFYGYEPFYNNLKDHINLPRIEEKINKFDGANIVDDSIEITATNFIKQSSNLYNYKTTTPNTFIDNTGVEQTSNQNAVSDFIKIKPNTTYTMVEGHTTVYYDENKNFISRPTNTGTFTTPNYAHWVRLVLLSNRITEEQLNLGSELLPYEDYYLTIGGVPLEHKENDIGETVDKNYYFTPEELTGYYKPSNLGYDDFSHYNASTSVQDVHDKFDELAINHQDYFTKIDEGTDESGLYSLHRYLLSPSLVEVSQLDNDKKIPKIIIVSGLHGEEKMSIFSLYYLVKDICENWRNNPVLNYLRWNVEIEFIPIANPYGFMQGSQGRRVNSNDVDLNRDFSDFSEKESQFVKKMIDENKNAILFVDYHTNGTSGNVYNTLMWHSNISNDLRSENIDISSKHTISLMTRKFIDEYNLPHDVGFFGFVSYSNTNGLSKMYSATKGIPSNTFECFRKFPIQEEYFNTVALEGCTAYIGNWLAVMIKQTKQTY